MIRAHLLTPATGSLKKKKRVGRGQGSGRGKTSTRGHNGHKSRSGYKFRAGFEGGQMPLQRRIPKFGFHNPFKKHFACINIGRLQDILDKNPGISDINPTWLADKGYISKRSLPVKILGRGEIKSSVTISAHKFTASAKNLIENAGGQILLIGQVTNEHE